MKPVQAPYRGWQTIEMHNEYVRLNIAPQLGGRVLNYQLGEHPFFWLNPLLAGQSPPSSGLAPDGSWLNWGGDKLWIAPQGWENADQWAGPPDPILDGGSHSAKILDSGASPAVQMTSSVEPRTGMQLSRRISLEPQSTHVNIIATMTNKSREPKRWGIWSVTQLDTGNRDGSGWNPHFCAYAPVNPGSIYPNGYRTLYGSPDNPQFRVSDGLLCVDYKRVVGKVGLDSSAGWMASIDGRSGNVFVQRTQIKPDAEYPDDASIEIWTNGLGSLTAYGKTQQMPEDPGLNPYLLEGELLSPFFHLLPEQSGDFTYDWYATNVGKRLGGAHRIIDCGAAGCTVAPLTVSPSGQISGHFGVFYEGTLAAEFSEGNGAPVVERVDLQQVTPFTPLVLDHQQIAIPEAARFIQPAIYSSDGVRLGALTHEVQC